MKYKKLSNEELQTFPYPNLIAELIESGYSICTLGEHMGLDGRREQDDPEILGKLRGREGIPATEAIGLCKLFNVGFSYLFNSKLETMGGKPLAYHRRYEWDRQKEKEYKKAVSVHGDRARTAGKALPTGAYERNNQMEPGGSEDSSCHADRG